MRGVREEGFISPLQGAILLWFSILPTAILFLPALLARRAQQDAWLSVVLAVALTLPLGLVVYCLAVRFPRNSLFQYSEIVLGKFGGKLLSLFYVLAFIQLNAIILREFSEFLVTAVMPETPLLVFTVTITAVAVYAARNGVEVIARSAEFVMPLMVAFFLIVLVLVTPQMSVRNLFPFLERGIRPVVSGAMLAWGFTGEIVVMTAIGAFVNPPREIRKSLLVGLTGVLLFLSSMVLSGVLVFGAAEAGRLSFMAFSMARLISIANFLERVEVLFMAIWVAGVFIKVTINLYIAALGLATVADLTEYRPLCAPLAALMVALSVLLFDNISEVFSFLEKIFPAWSLLWEFAVPVGLMLVAAIRKKKGGGV